jgi:hypothetical protein
MAGAKGGYQPHSGKGGTNVTETIRIPTEIQVLRERLSGLGRLLTARKWERAAIVYAFTEPGEIGRGRWYKPEPPKMHIREFAAQGFQGLTTNKAVSRYRDAWITAISNGWAVPVSPGQLVTLPDKEFPAWPYVDLEGSGTVTFEREDISRLRTERGPNRPVAERILSRLENMVKLLDQLAELSPDEIDPEVHRELVDRLSLVQAEARKLLTRLRRGLRAV